MNIFDTSEVYKKNRDQRAQKGSPRLKITNRGLTGLTRAHNFLCIMNSMKFLGLTEAQWRSKGLIEAYCAKMSSRKFFGAQQLTGAQKVSLMYTGAQIFKIILAKFSVLKKAQTSSSKLTKKSKSRLVY